MVTLCYHARSDAALSSTIVVEHSAHHAGYHTRDFRLSCVSMLLLWLWCDVSDTSQPEFSFHIPEQIALRRRLGINEPLLDELLRQP